MKHEERVRRFVRGIKDWFSIHKRTLPWRDLAVKNDDRRAYLVLVSEIMLQQTQVSRVVILYKNFVQKYPDPVALSKASNADVIQAWRGLGYNNRALRLRDAARRIIDLGMVPRDRDSLLELPGVGDYTAGAILNFAFGIPAACIDTNVRRILHRFFVGPENADGTWNKDDTYLMRLSEETMHEALRQGVKCSDWFAALMDFGSLVCTKNRPKWEEFNSDLKLSCLAYGSQIKRIKKVIKKEPGRVLGGRFIPNRIFRGRIVEELRDAQKGLTQDQIGSRIAVDWTMGNHRAWLRSLIEGLRRDRIVNVRGGRCMLSAS